MKNLIKKDFVAGSILVGIATLVIPFLTAISIWAMMDDFGGIALGFITFLAIGMCMAGSLIFMILDTATNIETTYAGLPISRVEIVLARYISSTALIVYSLFLMAVTVAMVSVSSDGYDRAFSILLSMRGISGILVFLLLIASVMYPFIFKYGISRGLKIYLFTMMGIGIIKPALNFASNILSGVVAIDISFIKTAFESTLNYVHILTPAEAYLLFAFLLPAIGSASILLSIKFYSKRDL